MFMLSKQFCDVVKHVLMDQFNGCFDFRNKKGLIFEYKKTSDVLSKIYKYE